VPVVAGGHDRRLASPVAPDGDRALDDHLVVQLVGARPELDGRAVSGALDRSPQGAVELEPSVQSMPSSVDEPSWVTVTLSVLPPALAGAASSAVAIPAATTTAPSPQPARLAAFDAPDMWSPISALYRST
jgi:hypothetical protein